MKAVVVCGPWGSGTTAVTRLLVGLGCLDVQPHFITNDPKTGSSYENIAFRQIVLDLVDENTVSLNEDKAHLAAARLLQFRENLERTCKAYGIAIDRAPIVLKHASSCLLIQHLSSVFCAKFVFVERNVCEIESGRIRRGWASIYGREGASRIYEIMGSYDGSTNLDIHKIKYSDLLERPDREAEGLARFCDLDFSKAAINKALAPIRSHQNYAILQRKS